MTKPDVHIDYLRRVHDALRAVVHSVLAEVAVRGLPGEHYFYLAFATGHPGVGISEALRAQHPETMTIVLQHDFRDLEVDSEGFDVTLRFGGVPQSLRVPFAALTSFFDPTVQFMLRFQPFGDEAQMHADEPLAAETAVRVPTAPAGGRVVSFDAFRRK